MHRFNRAAFFNADGSAPLLRLYARLVALELTLKDDDPTNYAEGHDVIEMVNKRSDPALTSLATALDTTLRKLWCSDKHGSPKYVNPQKYPDIRYLRHESDYSGTTTDADLTAALDALESLWKEFREKRLTAC